MRLKGKVAVVSGSGSGIGEATVKRFASEGAAVVVVDLNEEGANRVAAEIRKSGGAAEAFKANVGNPPEIESMVKFAVDKFGHLDILHNNAIRLYTGRIGEMTLENWRKSVDIGLTSYWYATRCALNVMVPRGTGAIVNTASVSGLAADYRAGRIQRDQGGRYQPDACNRDRIRAQRHPMQCGVPRLHPDAADREIAKCITRACGENGAGNPDGPLWRAERDRECSAVSGF
jgi:NAD(P)-dependent dehydrogenase (short-subunit alcohol dehydrogenase family)